MSNITVVVNPSHTPVTKVVVPLPTPGILVVHRMFTRYIQNYHNYHYTTMRRPEESEKSCNLT